MFVEYRFTGQKICRQEPHLGLSSATKIPITASGSVNSVLLTSALRMKCEQIICLDISRQERSSLEVHKS